MPAYASGDISLHDVGCQNNKSKVYELLYLLLLLLTILILQKQWLSHNKLSFIKKSISRTQYVWPKLNGLGAFFLVSISFHHMASTSISISSKSSCSPKTTRSFKFVTSAFEDTLEWALVSDVKPMIPLRNAQLNPDNNKLVIGVLNWHSEIVWARYE